MGGYSLIMYFLSDISFLSNMVRVTSVSVVLSYPGHGSLKRKEGNWTSIRQLLRPML